MYLYTCAHALAAMFEVCPSVCVFVYVCLPALAGCLPACLSVFGILLVQAFVCLSGCGFVRFFVYLVALYVCLLVVFVLFVFLCLIAPDCECT